MKAAVIVAMVIVGFFVAVVVLERFFQPTRRLELHLLSVALNHGSGWDDGAQGILMTNSSRYAPEIIRMLASAKPGSMRESTALATVEMVMDEPNVGHAMRDFGCTHLDVETASLVASILEGPVERIPVKGCSNTSGIVVYKIPLKRRRLGSLEEERSRLGCVDENDAWIQQ